MREPAVYACVCKAVTESAIQACHNAGLRNVRQVSSATRAGTGCGQCVSRLRSMLATARETESALTDSAA
jgi:bacterioferritin-associated ferredoxin